MCQAKFGGGLSSASAPPPSTTTAAPPAAGTGATHTVIVAPTKGVLRYVPFAVNASVGDTVRFMWGAGPHTVTKSSALTVCNKSSDASTFASGQQNASFVFDQVVNNTEPTFFFCAVPNHCQKGMFGIINPPSAPAGSASSVGAMMSTWTSQNPDLAKMQTAIDAMTINTPAYNWASNLDVANIPTEAHKSLVENIFYTRSFYAANTGADQGASRPDGQPIVIPNDVNTLLTGNTGAPAAGTTSAPAGAAPSSTPSSAPANSTPQPSTNGAGSVVASSALIVVAAVFSSLFLL
jgi:plastocyanin